jgi:hydrogenase maturation factor HypF (carbamoyltransferase family)
MKQSSKKPRTPAAPKDFRMFLIPCSCGVSFAVAEGFDRKGMHLRSFIPCPNCGKRQDPRNRLLRLDYQEEQFWKVGGC